MDILATPQAMDFMEPKTEKAILKEATVTRKGRSKFANLKEQIAYGMMLPSPQARDYKGKSIKRDRVPDSIERIGKETGGKFRLQPAFVEWMMGYPSGWTEFAFPKPNTEQKN